MRSPGGRLRIEARTFLLFSFEKMALRDAVRTPDGAREFACGLYDWLYGTGSERDRFERWTDTVGALHVVRRASGRGRW